MTIQKIEAHSPEAQSANLVADNIEKLKALFPELLTETVVNGKTTAALNVDVLKALVGDATVTDSDEKYGLNWHGKRRARQADQQQRAASSHKAESKFIRQRSSFELYANAGFGFLQPTS